MSAERTVEQLTKGAVILFALLAVFVLFKACSSSDKPSKPRHYGAQSGSDNYIWSSFDGSNRQLVAQIKAGLKDPSSFKLVGTGKKAEGQYLYVTMEYTATNSFGGRITGTALAKCDRQGNVLEILQRE